MKVRSRERAWKRSTVHGSEVPVNLTLPAGSNYWDMEVHLQPLCMAYMLVHELYRRAVHFTVHEDMEGCAFEAPFGRRTWATNGDVPPVIPVMRALL